MGGLGEAEEVAVEAPPPPLSVPVSVPALLPRHRTGVETAAPWLVPARSNDDAGGDSDPGQDNDRTVARRRWQERPQLEQQRRRQQKQKQHWETAACVLRANGSAVEIDGWQVVVPQLLPDSKQQH